MAQEIVIALGSNLGSDAGGRGETLFAAVGALATAGLQLRRISRFFATPCFPAGAGPDYVNACAIIGWTGSAQALLDVLHGIEADFGRERTQRWASRSLDLDLLAVGDTVLPDAQTQTHWRDLPAAEQTRAVPEQLILPHPRIQDRGFVLVPMADIAADWRHPLTGRTVTQMLANLPRQLRAEPRPL